MPDKKEDLEKEFDVAEEGIESEIVKVQIDIGNLTRRKTYLEALLKLSKAERKMLSEPKKKE